MHTVINTTGACLAVERCGYCVEIVALKLNVDRCFE